MITHRLHRRTLSALSVGVAALLLVAACSGSDNGSASSAGGRDASAGQGQSQGGGAAKPAAPEAGSASGQKAGGKAAGTSGQVDPAAVTASTQYLARSASLALKVKQVAAAAASVRSISAANDGIVLTENIGGGPEPADPNGTTVTPPSTYGEITISVPSDRLDRALDALSAVGTVVRRQSSSDNVREEYVDTQSRVETMRASVDRVRALMSKATDIAQVVTLESELSRRQADLEALEAQLASLKDRVSRAPIQVSLTTDATVVEHRDDDAGFLAGFTSGWRAFTSSVVALLTVVGALLPFAVAAVVIGLPVWWGVRRRRARRAEPAATPAG